MQRKKVGFTELSRKQKSPSIPICLFGKLIMQILCPHIQQMGYHKSTTQQPWSKTLLQLIHIDK